MLGDAKSGKMDPQDEHKRAKGHQKGAKREPKRSRGKAKREPKGDQNASKNRFSEKVTKREPKSSLNEDEMASFWEPASIPNR